jgi:hypothetical protein
MVDVLFSLNSSGTADYFWASNVDAKMGTQADLSNWIQFCGVGGGKRAKMRSGNTEAWRNAVSDRQQQKFRPTTHPLSPSSSAQAAAPLFFGP